MPIRRVTAHVLAAGWAILIASDAAAPRHVFVGILVWATVLALIAPGVAEAERFLAQDYALASLVTVTAITGIKAPECLLGAALLAIFAAPLVHRWVSVFGPPSGRG